MLRLTPGRAACAWQLQPNDLFRASFDRPNIRLSVRFKDVLGSALYQDLGNGLQRWLRKEPGASAIVYCRRRQACMGPIL